MTSSPKKRKPAYHADICIVKPEHQDDLIQQSKEGNTQAQEVVEALIGYLRHDRAGLKCACCDHRFRPKEEPGAIASLIMQDLKDHDPIRAVAFGVCRLCAMREDLPVLIYRTVSGFFPAGDIELLGKGGHA